MKLLGIPIDEKTALEVLAFAQDVMNGGETLRIATVNPEFLLLARRDIKFREALLSADLRIADGFGVVLAARLHGKRIKRFPGADITTVLLAMAAEKGMPVYLAVKEGGLSGLEEIKAALLKEYPALKIHGSSFRFPFHDAQLEIREPSVVLCNFGAPYQEISLAQVRRMAPVGSLLLGVGGSFDYLTGKLPRAPYLLRSAGLEWLWRLFLQPRRFCRIWNAVIVFPALCLLEKRKQGLAR